MLSVVRCRSPHPARVQIPMEVSPQLPSLAIRHPQPLQHIIHPPSGRCIAGEHPLGARSLSSCAPTPICPLSVLAARLAVECHQSFGSGFVAGRFADIEVASLLELCLLSMMLITNTATMLLMPENYGSLWGWVWDARCLARSSALGLWP